MKKQLGLFDFQNRIQELSDKGDPLQKLDKIIPWENFRDLLKKTVNKEEGKAGRHPYDVILMFKIIILQILYDLSDEQTEFQIRDRLTFMRFIGIDFHDKIPDENTIWSFKEKLKELGLVEKLFFKFNKFLDQKGLISKKGSIIDATIIEVPRQRNTRKENEKIKNDEIPKDWEKNQNKMSQKDIDARWTKKNGKTYFGYKNHICSDIKRKFITSYVTSPASVHDSQLAPDLLKKIPKGSVIYADSAYHSVDISKMAKARNLKTKIIKKGYRNKLLTEKENKIYKSYLKINSKQRIFSCCKQDWIFRCCNLFCFSRCS